jgi:hypothetical protein
MFILCIIRCSRNDQQYAMICTIPLFNILAPTCFGSSLPSSGSFLDPSEILEIQIELVVYRIMCGYVACVLDCRGSVYCASQLSAYQYSAGKHNRRNHNNPAHRSHNHTLYDIPPIQFVFQLTQTDPRSSLMMADYCRNM